MAVTDGARLSTTFVNRLEQNLTTALDKHIGTQSHQLSFGSKLFPVGLYVQ